MNSLLYGTHMAGHTGRESDMQTATNHDETVHLVALTDAEATMLRGLVSHYRHSMLLDLRKGQLTESGIRQYRQDLAESGEIMVKLGGRS